MTTLRSNQRVRVSDETGAAVYGRIEETRQMGAETLAVISYHTSPEAQFLLTVLGVDGEWFDLKHCKLEIEVVGPA